MRLIGIAVIWLTSCQAQSSRVDGMGQILGKLTGEDGAGIGGGAVNLTRLPPYPKRLQQTVWTAITGSDGAFQFGRLFDGTYRLCAQVPKSDWLNPCQWGLQYPTVTVSSAEPVIRTAIALKRGARVGIRLEDLAQRLTLHEGKTPGAHVLIGVANDALVFMPARRVSDDASGRSLEVVIPFNSQRKLVVRSAFFQLADGAGLPLAAARATMIPLTVLAGQTPIEVRLRVTGAGMP